MTARPLLMVCAALLAGGGNLQAQPADLTPAGPDLPVSVLSRLDATLASLDIADGDQPTERTDRSSAAQQTFDWAAQGRACEGCPPRSVGRAVFQSAMINVFYGLANLLRGHDTAKITPKTWWANMEQGWVWDLSDFPVNQIGHPYQGNNYFTAGRANGLSFYESSAVGHHQQRVDQLESRVARHRRRLGVQAAAAIRRSGIRQPARRGNGGSDHGRRRHS